MRKFFGEILRFRCNIAAMHWKAAPIHFIDFEGSQTSGILEFGVVTLHQGEILRTRTRLCRAQGHIRREDSLLHGLNQHELSGYALFSEEFDYFAGLREAGPLAAHYAHAENSLLKSVWAYPRLSSDFARAGMGFTQAEWGPWIDTGRLYAELFPTLESGKLQHLIFRFGLQTALDAQAAIHCPPNRRRYHAALYDALAGALLLHAAVSRPELSEATLPWLLQLSTANAEKRAGLRQTELF